MRRRILPWVTVVLLILLANVSLAATSTVVLAVEGMT